MGYSAHTDTFAREHLPPRDQWPEFVFEHPSVQYPQRLNCATEILDRQADGPGADAPAIRAVAAGQPVRWAYRELRALANRIARVLVEDLGLEPGNRVLLRAPNNPMLAACWFAVVKAGGIVVPTMQLLRARELERIIGKARVGIALCDARLAAELDLAASSCPELRRVVHFNGGGADSLEALAREKPAQFDNVDTAADDVAAIAFTSGTTGVPKGAMHFHRSVMAMCDCFPGSILSPVEDDIFCGTPPLAFTFGLAVMLGAPLRFGASTVLVEQLTPAALLQTIQDFGCTIVSTAPTFYRQMAPLARGFDLSSLRLAVSSGEALPEATRALFRDATGIELIDGLGATELMQTFVAHLPGRARRGAVGYAIPGYRIAVLDERGDPCPSGAVGKLAVKGPSGCLYLDDERQKEYVRGGWNLTGDACSMDEDGYLYFHGRTDDLIVSAGYNIAGLEVESALLAHDAVAECCVVGTPDPERGQLVSAFVVLRPGYSGGETMVRTLQDFVKSVIAPYKYPRRIEFVEALPRTETGKLQRFKLRGPGSTSA